MTFHHIGVATLNIEASSAAYSLLGYNVGLSVYDPNQKVNLCFLEKENSPIIELVSPTEEGSPINNILKKNGTTPYHTCFEVEDIENEILILKRNKFMVVVKPIEAIAFGNRRVAFLYNKDAGLIELLEKKYFILK